MERMPIRIPGFPIVPLVFPIGLALSLLASIAWFQYQIWREVADWRTTPGTGQR